MIDKQPWNCSACWKSFSKFSHLTKHMEDHHPFDDSAVDHGSKRNSKIAKALGSKYKCKVCQEFFPDKNLLRTHSCAGRPVPKIYKCKTCPKEFLYMCKLVQHERIHVMDKPYKCDLCCCSFSQACHLGRHMQTHSASASNKCIVCSKVFKNSALLQKHKLIHNTENLFKCDFCPNTFSDLSLLATHLDGHLKGKKVSFDDSTESGRLETLETKSKAEPRIFKKAKRIAGSDRKLNFRSCKTRSSYVDSSHWGKGRNIFKTETQKNVEILSDSQKVEKSVAESKSDIKSILETEFDSDFGKKALGEKEGYEAHHEFCSMKEEQLYACGICQLGFDSSSLFELHVKNDHQEKKILPNDNNGLCMLRPSLFETLERLSSPEVAMLKVSSPSGMSRITSTPKRAIFLVNSEKSLTFTNPREDAGMIDFTSQAKRFLGSKFRCLICNKNFADSFALDRHLEKHIIVKTLPRNRHTIWSIHFPQKKFCCKICRKSFSQRTILQGHSRIMHHGLNKRPIKL